MEYDPQPLEDHWRNRWRSEGWYDVDPTEERTSFITVPYPYPSGGMHIGHARTYTVPDVYARYRRLQGDNVLFPIAWHVTGTPIIGAVERLKKGEKEQLRVLRDTYNVPEATLRDLETPMGFARYFIEHHYKQGMRQLGLSIDWRREFTTNDDRYKKFITWQYETLYNRGLLEKGKHPVKFCTNERNPVTAHDLLEGENAEFQEYTLIRFQWNDTIVPMATLRPETVRGVTNAFIDPEASYIVATVDGERWFISKSASEKLELQGREVEQIESGSGERLVGESVINPVTGDEILVIPAGFVDPDNATGVVMSVPGHSPDDWVALQEAKQDPERLRDFDLDPDRVRQIEPRSIIEIEGYGKFPAEDTVRDFGIESSTDPNLKDATQELYNREFHTGRLKSMYGPFSGKIVEDAREDIKAEYRSTGSFDVMYEFTEDVVCRCGGDVEVAYQDTWFLNYDNQTWKEKTYRVVDELDTIPENTREQYRHTIDWLQAWPCIRNYGLGTRLPWDTDFVIEPLSDSTIYMAYYTIAHRIDEIPIDDLDHEFFDTLFFGPDTVNDPDERAVSLREEWSYWYPVDYRCSGNDLITNHLTFYLFHHAELFDQQYWPKGITTMGMGLLEGEKMSSSKGHVVLPDDAIDEYGADTVRFFLLNSAEPWQDYDWRTEQVSATRAQLERFWNRAYQIIDGEKGSRDLEQIDYWLLSKLQTTIDEVSTAMDRFETRSASQAAFYRFEEHLRWYRRRTDLDRPGARWTLRHVLEGRLRLLAPIIPFMTNELYEALNGTGMRDVSWPTVDPQLKSLQTEMKEQVVENLVEDVSDIIDVIDQSPNHIDIYVAADWKFEVFDEVVETGPEVGEVMNQVMKNEELRKRGNVVNDLVNSLVDLSRDYSEKELTELSNIDEKQVYDEAAEFLSQEFGASIECRSESAVGESEQKASSAIPYRPAIQIT